jgi:hypothetical protein
VFLKSQGQQRSRGACWRHPPFVNLPILAFIAPQFTLQGCSATRICFTWAMAHKKFANGFIAPQPVLARPPGFATSHDRQPQCSFKR